MLIKKKKTPYIYNTEFCVRNYKKRHLQLSQIEKDKGECCIQLPCTEIAGTSLATLNCISSEYRGLMAHWSSLIFLWKHYTEISQRSIWRLLQFHIKTCSHEEQLFVTCTDCWASDLVCVLFIQIANVQSFFATLKMHIWGFFLLVLFSDLVLSLYYILEK